MANPKCHLCNYVATSSVDLGLHTENEHPDYIAKMVQDTITPPFVLDPKSPLMGVKKIPSKKIVLEFDGIKVTIES